MYIGTGRSAFSPFVRPMETDDSDSGSELGSDWTSVGPFDFDTEPISRSLTDYTVDRMARNRLHPSGYSSTCYDTLVEINDELLGRCRTPTPDELATMFQSQLNLGV
jgi:hypothetical protein